MAPSSVETLPAPDRPRPAACARSLAPREHGAYGQIALPLIAALGMGRPGASAILMTSGALCAFVAHEPVLVATGLRGSRALREEGGRARRRLAILGAATALAGGAGLWLAPGAARLAAAVSIVLALALAVLIARGQEKTTPGELLAAGALASAAVPVAIASGVAPASAWGAWAAWGLVLGASTVVVRAVIAHARAPLAWPRRLVAPAIAAAVAAALAFAGVLPGSAAIGVVPMIALALALALRPPSPRSLKRVGWALVSTSAALAAALAVGSHL